MGRVKIPVMISSPAIQHMKVYPIALGLRRIMRHGLLHLIGATMRPRPTGNLYWSRVIDNLLRIALP